MPTVTPIKRKRGTVYRAQIRLKQGGVLIHTEAATFSTRAAARRWGEDREAQLKADGGLARERHRTTTLKDVVDQYLEESGTNLGRTKKSHLKMLQTFEISQLPVLELTTEKLLKHLRNRRAHVSGSTAGNDITWIRVVLEHAKLAWNLDVDLSITDNTRIVARKLRLIGRPQERDRRPTADELNQLRHWFSKGHTGPGSPSEIPMTTIIDFAVASARRQGEITRLRWEDLDKKKHICLLRDAKSPTGSQGNHRLFALTKEALTIIERQPKTSDWIFPFNSKTIGTYFTNACKLLGIVDLRFHDLRHEATSRLFEAGYQIHEVQQFTLHDQWSTLQRYTQLKPEAVSGR